MPAGTAESVMTMLDTLNTDLIRKAFQIIANDGRFSGHIEFNGYNFDRGSLEDFELLKLCAMSPHRETMVGLRDWLNNAIQPTESEELVAAANVFRKHLASGYLRKVVALEDTVGWVYRNAE